MSVYNFHGWRPPDEVPVDELHVFLFDHSQRPVLGYLAAADRDEFVAGLYTSRFMAKGEDFAMKIPHFFIGRIK